MLNKWQLILQAKMLSHPQDTPPTKLQIERHGQRKLNYFPVYKNIHLHFRLRQTIDLIIRGANITVVLIKCQ